MDPVGVPILQEKRGMGSLFDRGGFYLRLTDGRKKIINEDCRDLCLGPAGLGRTLSPGDLPYGRDGIGGQRIRDSRLPRPLSSSRVIFAQDAGGFDQISP